MTTIKKLTLKLKSGLLSELHSDTVMGHFCWRLKDKYGEDKLKEFISSYYKESPLPPFTITNGLIEKDYWDDNRKNVIRTELFFPKPLLHLKKTETTEKPKKKKELMIDFLLNKELKSFDLLTTEQFNLAINGKLDELYDNVINDKLERPKFETYLKVSVEIDRYSLSAREGQLFSYHPKFLDEDTKVVFLIRVLNKDLYNDFKCEEVLKDVFEIGFGKKKSSGFGQFEICGGIEDFDKNKINEPKDANAFITLGNYLPSAYDGITQDCFYDFIVKYGRLSEEKSLSENPFKKPLVLFTPGSIFRIEKQREFYGRVTQSGHISEFDLESVQFGIPFSLNFSLP
jgi:CRISPR-associated protein Csm4